MEFFAKIFKGFVVYLLSVTIMLMTKITQDT